MNKSINGCWCNKRHNLLYPVLRKWIKINMQFAELEKGAGPWGDTERSSIGILAGAIWKSNNYCFEEYHYEKRNSKINGKLGKGKYKGRIDIWFKANNKEYIGEAKRCYPDASHKKANKMCYKINQIMSKACSDVNKIYANKAIKRKIAILFVNPFFTIGQSNLTVKEFVHKITNEIECDAMAWVFPKIARETNVFNKKRFPGTAIIIKEN
jgi:hypothetical protein